MKSHVTGSSRIDDEGILGVRILMARDKTILVVDDDAALVAGLQAVLEDRGYRVATAHDGAEGQLVAEREQPDLVIVDMMMPKKSGFLVLEFVKTRLPSPPSVLMITANEGSGHQAYAELLGVDAYLRKPFAMEKFLSSVAHRCPLERDGPEG
jgi:DNA-binding response OmpR family regulator